MRLTHRQLDYIREVAAKSSISDACKTSRVSSRMIFAAISAAEDSVGTGIFTRPASHGVGATPVGQRVLISDRRLLSGRFELERLTDESVQRPRPR